MRIAVTGTPGVGKTSASKILSRDLGYSYLDINKAVREKKLYSSYDRKRKSYIVDMKKLSDFLRKHTKSGDWILDSHVSHLLPRSLMDMVFVLRCEPQVLKKRLSKKKWLKSKVQENYEAELVGVISYEARKHNSFEIDCTRRSPKATAGLIEKILKGKKYRKTSIDWLSPQYSRLHIRHQSPQQRRCRIAD